MARILFLAPQPFYQERGTPIAVDLALRVLAAEGHEVDLLTYAEGDAREYPRLTHRRLPRVPGVGKVPPGFSWKKAIYSSLLIPAALRLARGRRYDLVHAVEEAVFVAMLLKRIYSLPFVYDMDSALARQLVDKARWLRPLSPVFRAAERTAIRQAVAVIAVCPALVAHANACGAQRSVLLQDVALLDDRPPGREATDLRQGLAASAMLILYVGNLERYQGVDLLLEGFAAARRRGSDAALAVIGGVPADVERYRRLASQLGIGHEVRFLGPRPLEDLGAYLAQADVVVSPRTRGNNTPMKVYSYLASGKPLLATKIDSHTQVLDDEVACLVTPDADGVATGIARLAGSPDLRARLGEAGARRAAERHTWPVFRRTLADAYAGILGETIPGRAEQGARS
ncbi:MAG: glycosyltransferase family 4 protein [Candidatus Krumholzibacteriia bacterium]